MKKTAVKIGSLIIQASCRITSANKLIMKCVGFFIPSQKNILQ